MADDGLRTLRPAAVRGVFAKCCTTVPRRTMATITENLPESRKDWHGVGSQVIQVAGQRRPHRDDLMWDERSRAGCRSSFDVPGVSHHAASSELGGGTAYPVSAEAKIGKMWHTFRRPAGESQRGQLLVKSLARYSCSDILQQEVRKGCPSGMVNNPYFSPEDCEH